MVKHPAGEVAAGLAANIISQQVETGLVAAD
jgi:hypothetical protein